MNNLLQFYFDIVGFTATIFIVLSAILSENVHKMFRRAMISDIDLESSSSVATETLIDDFTQGPEGNYSIVRLFLFYAVANALVFAALRYLQPAMTFRAAGSDYWSLIVVAVLSGLAWFFASFFVSRVSLAIIKRVSNLFQWLVVILDVVFSHFVIVFVIVFLGTLNIGVNKIFELESGGILRLTIEYTRQIWTIETGVDQVVLAQYLAAFVTTAILLSQVFIALISRLLHKGERASSESIQEKQSWIVRNLVVLRRRLIKPDVDPFMVGAFFFIITESFVFALYVTVKAVF